MTDEAMKSLNEMQIDCNNLYREESYSDLKVGTIRVLIPVKADGTPDASRETVFSGETQLLTQMGMVPVHCRIEAKSLDEAIQGFPRAVSEAVERMIEEAREYQRKEASRIVVPGRDFESKVKLR